MGAVGCFDQGYLQIPFVDLWLVYAVIDEIDLAPVSLRLGVGIEFPLGDDAAQSLSADYISLVSMQTRSDDVVESTLYGCAVPLNILLSF